MGRFNFKSTCKGAVAAPLIVVLLTRMTFAGGLLLHDHGDDAVHSHAVALDNLHEGGLHESWYDYHLDIHHEDRADKNGNPDDGESADPLLIFMDAPGTALGIHCSFGAVTASIQHPSSKVLHRSMLLIDPSDTCRLSAASWAWAPSLRPDSALDALLQSSHALLL